MVLSKLLWNLLVMLVFLLRNETFFSCLRKRNFSLKKKHSMLRSPSWICLSTVDILFCENTPWMIEESRHIINCGAKSFSVEGLGTRKSRIASLPSESIFQNGVDKMRN